MFIAKIFAGWRRKIPGAAKFIQHFIVDCNKAEIFPETIRIVGARGH